MVVESKFWPSVTEDGGSVDTLHYKLGASDFKCEGWSPDSNYTLKFDVLNPICSKVATQLEDILSGFKSLNNLWIFVFLREYIPSVLLRQFA